MRWKLSGVGPLSILRKKFSNLKPLRQHLHMPCIFLSVSPQTFAQHLCSLTWNVHANLQAVLWGAPRSSLFQAPTKLQQFLFHSIDGTLTPCWILKLGVRRQKEIRHGYSRRRPYWERHKNNTGIRIWVEIGT